MRGEKSLVGEHFEEHRAEIRDVGVLIDDLAARQIGCCGERLWRVDIHPVPYRIENRPVVFSPFHELKCFTSRSLAQAVSQGSFARQSEISCILTRVIVSIGEIGTFNPIAYHLRNRGARRSYRRKARSGRDNASMDVCERLNPVGTGASGGPRPPKSRLSSAIRRIEP